MNAMQGGKTKAVSPSDREPRSVDGLSVFDFDSHVDFLGAVAAAYLKGARRLTLDQWVARLGYRSPRSVAMVLKGQRLPSLSLVLAIGRDLKLSRPEQRYLELLVHLAKQQRAGLPTDDVYAAIQRLVPTGTARTTLNVGDSYFSRVYGEQTPVCFRRDGTLVTFDAVAPLRVDGDGASSPPNGRCSPPMRRFELVWPRSIRRSYAKTVMPRVFLGNIGRL
jgi:hypothetical protein